jgi:hypothetical protein
MASRNSSRSVSRSVSSNSLPQRRTTPVAEPSPAEKEKEALIAAACRDRDVSTLVNLATSTSGLISDSLRRTACMLFPTVLLCIMTDHFRASSTRMLRSRYEEYAMGEASTPQRRASSWLRRQPRLRLLSQEWYVPYVQPTTVFLTDHRV